MLSVFDIDHRIDILHAWPAQGRIAMPQDAPIGGLPPEILSEIFIHSVQDAPSPLSAVLSALILVCIDWRNVALATPQLWTIINLDAYDEWPYIVEFMFSHSGDVPLEIYAISGEVDWWYLGTLLQKHAHRWTTIAIKVSSDKLWRYRVTLPVLEDLCVILTQPGIYGCLDFVAQASRLRKLEICSLVKCDKDEGYHTDFFLDVLRHCAQTLEELELKMEAWRNHSDCVPDSYAPITLPRLTSARLSQYTHTILLYIVAPRLTHVRLGLCTEASGDGDAFASLLAFLEGGLNAVESLNVEHVFVESPVDFMRCLHKLTRLTTLRVEGYPGTRTLLGAPSLGSLHQSVMLPNLTNIAVHYLGGICPATVDAWYKLLEWRSQERIHEGVVIKALVDVDADVADISLRAPSPTYTSGLLDL